MIPPKNHAFFVSQTFTRHCNFRTSLLLLIASGALTGSCRSRAESSAAWALSALLVPAVEAAPAVTRQETSWRQAQKVMKPF